MIRSYKNKFTEAVRNHQPPKRFPADLHLRAQRKLAQLDAASVLSDMRIPPSNRLEPLKGQRKGQHSIRINTQWRVCFIWHDGAAFEVEIVDYH